MSSQTERKQTTKLASFRLFLAEPVLFLRLQRFGSQGRVLLLIPLMYGLTLAFTNISTLPAGAKVVPGAWCYEASRLLRWAVQFTCSYQPRPQFLLLQDLPNILIQAILSITPYIVYRQWCCMQDLIQNLVADHLVKSTGDDDCIAKEVKAANRYFLVAGWHCWIFVAVAIFATLLVTIGYSQLGMFESLAPPGLTGKGLDSWTSQSYLQWWGNYEGRPMGWLAFVALSSFGVFYILLMNVVGMRVVWLVYQIRKAIVFEASVDIVDGYWGYWQVRQVLRFSYIALFLHGVAMGLAALSMSGSTALLFLGPLLGQWLIVLPTLVLLPALLLRRDIPAWRRRELIRIQQAINSLVAAGADRTEAEVAGLRERADRVRGVRSLPFGRPRDIFYVGLSIVGALVTIGTALANQSG